MTLRPVPVTEANHVELMRRVRNFCAAGFANFNGQISATEQASWWAANRQRVRAWLYFDDAGQLVGFGLLTRHADGRDFTTVGVAPGARGYDYGKAITAHLIVEAPGRVYGCARRDNPAAVKLHVSDDWVEMPGDDPNLIYFRTLKADPWPTKVALEQWAETGWAGVAQ